MRFRIGFLFFSFWLGYFQVWSQKLRLPEPVTNQSSALLQKDASRYIYTFFGLDATKKWSGVHNKVLRLNIGTGESKSVGNVPDGMGRLASAGSAINNKAYVVGGYTVFENGKEKSSRSLFIFNPQTESFTKGPDLPLAIDDQVQAVWRDSLLFVVSGWSDSVNVRSVQVYNPSRNQWNLATPLPDDKQAAVFGGCGTIVGDTIYLLGGAMFEKLYPPSRRFYKGRINAQNPLEIHWIQAGEYPGEFRYRSAAFSLSNKIYFLGGSNETYNYDGISYDGKQPVAPNSTMLIYEMVTGKFTTCRAPVQVMDLRNILHGGGNVFFVVGGMDEFQKVKEIVETVSVK